MFKVTQGAINVKGLTHYIGVEDFPKDKRIQVFVYSKRAKLWYPQCNPYPIEDGTKLGCKVILGDEGFRTGKYNVVAVALEGEPVWGPQEELPPGYRTDLIKFHRRGF